MTGDDSDESALLIGVMSILSSRPKQLNYSLGQPFKGSQFRELKWTNPLGHVGSLWTRCMARC